MTAKPTARQLEWQDMELGVIIHWLADIYEPGFQGYKTKEVRTVLHPSKICPEKLDTDQWLRSASKLGAKYAVLVANHCTGFSVWPTKENDYSVASTPWRNGKGDVIADFLASCEKYGISPGLYYSTGCNGYYGINDSEKQDYTAPYYREYVGHVENQLTEIWSEYGKLFEIWFDGGIVPVEKGGPDVPGLLKKYQPDAITFQGPPGNGNNVRWIGNENGFAPDDCMCACGSDESGKGSIDGVCYCPAEADFPNRSHKAAGGGWGWAKDERQFVIPPEELLGCYLNTVGRNANMLLGMGIAADGTFEDEDQFEEFGRLLRKEFSEEIACRVTDDGDTVTLDCGEIKQIRYIVIRENLSDGQKIAAYSVSADGKTIYSGNNIGHKRIIATDDLNAERIEIKIEKAYDGYSLRDVKLYA